MLGNICFILSLDISLTLWETDAFGFNYCSGIFFRRAAIRDVWGPEYLYCNDYRGQTRLRLYWLELLSNYQQVTVQFLSILECIW